MLRHVTPVPEGAYAAYGSVWHYGDNVRTFGGTARTLDEADGETELIEDNRADAGGPPVPAGLPESLYGAVLELMSAE